MALLSRISRLVAADAHALLDALEEPHVMLAAAVRDMEAAIAADKSTLSALQSELAELRRSRQADAERMEATNRQLDLALVAAEDSLCRELVRRKLLVRRRMESADESVTSREARISATQERLADRSQRLDSLRQRAALARLVPAHVATEHNAAVSDADIDIALLEERRARQSS